MIPTVEDRLQAAGAHLAANRIDEAAFIYRDVLGVDPQNAPAMAGLGTILLRQGALDEAFEVLGRATTLDRANPDPYRNLAVVYRARGEPDNARTCLDAALSLAPDDIDILLPLAEVLLELGRTEECVGLVEKAHRLAPETPAVLTALGGVHMLRGDLPKAIACYRRTLELEPTSAEAHANLATIYGPTGRPKQALEHAERAHLAEPLNPSFTAILAGALDDVGESEHGLALVNRALVLHPQVIDLHCRKAALLLSLGQVDEALSGIAAKLREHRDDVQLLEVMTDLLHRAGRPEQALAAARELLRLAPQSSQGKVIERHALLSLDRSDEVWSPAPEKPARPRRLNVVVDRQMPVLEVATLLRAVALGRASGDQILVGAPEWIAPLAQCVPAGAAGEDGAADDARPETISLLDLPARLGLAPAEMAAAAPYLAPDPAKAEMWAEALRELPRPLIGFTWAPYRPGPRIEDMRRLLSEVGGTPVSLVWDQNRAQLAMMAEAIDAGVQIKGLDDAVAAVAGLDAVIGIDSLPLHVAGALGKPGVAIVPRRRFWYWRTADQAAALWHPTIQVVERAPGEAWEKIADAARAGLNIALGRQAPPASITTETATAPDAA